MNDLERVQERFSQLLLSYERYISTTFGTIGRAFVENSLVRLVGLELDINDEILMALAIIDSQMRLYSISLTGDPNYGRLRGRHNDQPLRNNATIAADWYVQCAQGLTGWRLGRERRRMRAQLQAILYELKPILAGL